MHRAGRERLQPAWTGRTPARRPPSPAPREARSAMRCDRSASHRPARSRRTPARHEHRGRQARGRRLTTRDEIVAAAFVAKSSVQSGPPGWRGASHPRVGRTIPADPRDSTGAVRPARSSESGVRVCWSQPPDQAATNLRRTHVHRHHRPPDLDRLRPGPRGSASSTAAATPRLPPSTTSASQWAGAVTAIMGPSGSAPTLLHLLAGLDRPLRARHRRHREPAQRQGAHPAASRPTASSSSRSTLPTMTAAENIVLPMRIAGRKPTSTAASIVETVGLTGSLHRPSEPPVDSSKGSPPHGLASLQRSFAESYGCPGSKYCLLSPQPSPSSARPSSWSPRPDRGELR